MSPRRKLRIDRAEPEAVKGPLAPEKSPQQAASASSEGAEPVENCPVVRCHSVLLRRSGRGRTRITFF
ncbi:MAG: hypothetical protein JSS27_19800 [Planctomycetes bacterium]|nr:hypothetical protein [Planctomycetota bacterium]